MKDNYNKKVVITIVLSVVVLLLAVIATSYAMFTFTGTGTKENKLVTGSVSMNCDETSFTLTDTQVLSDAAGIALNNNEATCTLTTTLRGTMTIGYDVALYDVDVDTPNDLIGEDNVKIRASKTKNNVTSYLAGSSENTGVLVSSIKNIAGTYDNTITNYKIDSATTNATEEVVYSIKAWVANEASGTSTDTSINGKCSDATKTTKAACEEAGGVWGYEQKHNQAGGSFSFKLRAGASQIVS